MNVQNLEQIIQELSSIANDPVERAADRQHALRAMVSVDRLLSQAKRVARAEMRTAIDADRAAEKTPSSTTQPLPFSPEARVG